MTLGQYLRELRKAQRLTLETVGRRIGTTRFRIHKWEAGRSAMSARQLSQYLAAVDADLGQRDKALQIAGSAGDVSESLVHQAAPSPTMTLDAADPIPTPRGAA